jgi:hypothetical protein
MRWWYSQTIFFHKIEQFQVSTAPILVHLDDIIPSFFQNVLGNFDVGVSLTFIAVVASLFLSIQEFGVLFLETVDLLMEFAVVGGSGQSGSAASLSFLVTDICRHCQECGVGRGCS